MKKVLMMAVLALASAPAFASTASSTAFFPEARVMCRAVNLRGQVFREIGVFPGLVQSRALNACRSVSARCRPLGCARF